jgi:GNAT superfamily N-acetyltransferase
MITPELREYAETPDRFAPIPDASSVTRVDDGRICIIQGADWASVSAPNVEPDDVEALRDHVRASIAPGKQYAWWIGPSARPGDIYDRLRALGLTDPRDRVGTLHALALTDEPAPMPPGVEVRRVESFDDFVDAREVQWDAFETPGERREASRARYREDFDESMRVGVPVGYVAMLDGAPAGTAMAIPSERGVFLIAGAVARAARGRGLYRALVRARWDDAVARGTPALITHANPSTSYPILKRLGFEDVCTIRRLEDPA